MGRCIASDVFRVPVPSPVDFDYTLWYRLEKVRTMNSLVGKNLKHFHIEKLLGKGGMGVVYLGRDTRLDRPVAVKVLRQDLTANRDRQPADQKPRVGSGRSSGNRPACRGRSQPGP